jgi:hypothetical protein
MAVLVTAIHAVKPVATPKGLRGGAAWMAGTSPAMTVSWQ